jgi:AraC family transcriptional regulator
VGVKTNPLSNNPYLNQEYRGRINRVMDYIETRLDHDFRLEELAEVAAFSPYHFHRLFSAIVGETLFQFIQRVRVERAAASLLNKPKAGVTEIALDCGFSGPATFSRAFRAAFGMSPTQWRARRGENAMAGAGDERNPRKTERNADQRERNPRQAQDGQPPYAWDTESKHRRTDMTEVKNQQVEVKELPEMTVAYVRHVGPFQGDAELFEKLWERLMKWAGPRGLAEGPGVEYIIVYHDTPEITDDAKLRVSVCITVPEDTQVDGEIGKMTVPGGKYALARFRLAPPEYGQAWGWTYGTWLPESGYQPDDRPAFEWYRTPNEMGPNGEMLVDIVIPVKPL